VNATIAAMMLATVSSVYPGFLIGALSVQVSAEFDVPESVYGRGLGGFFLAATVGSVTLGKLVQKIGPRRQIAALLGVAAAMQMLIATVADSFAQVVGLLVVCGLANSGNQAAVNLALTRARVERLGLAIALKQSGMPAASLLSGLAVPALALTAGWRWAFVLGAALSVITLVFVLAVLEPMAPAERRRPVARPASTPTALILAAASGGLMSFGAGSLNAWLVSSGVDAGLGEGAAGLVLSLGAASGIIMRLYSGTRVDSMARGPFLVGGATALFGAVGMAALASRVAGVHVAATFLAFASGWIFPVFTNFGIIRRNPDAAGAATGTTQMGIYIGVFSAPLLTGPIIEAYGYTAMWLVVATAVAAGAITTMAISDRF
jgi:predicted MFS family arabinose efflux permease